MANDGLLHNTNGKYIIHSIHAHHHGHSDHSDCETIDDGHTVTALNSSKLRDGVTGVTENHRTAENENETEAVALFGENYREQMVSAYL